MTTPTWWFLFFALHFILRRVFFHCCRSPPILPLFPLGYGMYGLVFQGSTTFLPKSMERFLRPFSRLFVEWLASFAFNFRACDRVFFAQGESEFSFSSSRPPPPNSLLKGLFWRGKRFRGSFDFRGIPLLSPRDESLRNDIGRFILPIMALEYV